VWQRASVKLEKKLGAIGRGRRHWWQACRAQSLSAAFPRGCPGRAERGYLANLGALLESVLPPADRRLQALLARDLTELLALGRVRHRREAEHLLAVLECGDQPAHVIRAVDGLLVLLHGDRGQPRHTKGYFLRLLHEPLRRHHPVDEPHAQRLRRVDTFPEQKQLFGMLHPEHPWHDQKRWG